MNSNYMRTISERLLDNYWNAVGTVQFFFTDLRGFVEFCTFNVQRTKVKHYPTKTKLSTYNQH